MVMNAEKKILGLIPARGGSKGIPRKNITPLFGKPLIAWTIETAQKSQYIDRIVVSTEDAEIANIAAEFGSPVPFFRPGHLSRDATRIEDVIIHAIQWLDELDNYRPDYIFLLHVTSPMRRCEDIDRPIEILMNKEKQIDAVFGLSEVTEHPYGMKTIDKFGIINKYLDTKKYYYRRQDLPQVYIGTGAVYLCKTDIFKKENTMTPRRTFGYLMPKETLVDIDDEFDLIYAETLMKKHQKE